MVERLLTASNRQHRNGQQQQGKRRQAKSEKIIHDITRWRGDPETQVSQTFTAETTASPPKA
jgi:hypothetical protein